MFNTSSHISLHLESEKKKKLFGRDEKSWRIFPLTLQKKAVRQNIQSIL